MKIVGIDPGTHRIGYALVETHHRTPRLRRAETIATRSGLGTAARLAELSALLRVRLRRDRPDMLALERLFFQKNVKTAMAVAEARGAILLTAHGLVRSIGEYAPLEVKLAVAGYGRADKSQVRRMVHTILRDAAIPPGDDAVDAIAIALTAAYVHGHPWSSSNTLGKGR